MIIRLSFAKPFAFLALGALILSGCDTQSGDSEQAADEEQATDAENPASGSAVVGDDGPPPHPALSGKLDISKRGTPMPDVAFTAPDGSATTLAEFKGKPLLINLWATWCAPCVVEMPTLDALAGREDRLQVLVVSEDIQGNALVLPFFEKSKFENLKPYTDTQNALGFAYATGIMPTTILYDSQGQEVWRMLGGMNWNGPRAAAMMEETLAQ